MTSPVRVPALERRSQQQMKQHEQAEHTEETAQRVIHSYLLERVEEYKDLQEQREKGWKNEKADKHFNTQRQNADHADEKTQVNFWKMMQKIGTEMSDATGAFRFPGVEHIRVLDLCMAPGGYVAAVLDRHSNATVRAFTLPENQAGHKVRLTQQQQERCEISYMDITMLAADMGLSVADIPAGHPGAGEFRMEKLLAADERFDIVFCDGQVQREQLRAEWRKHREATRLTLVQLVMGLEHVKEGGTMVVLLHKVESYHNLRLLSAFERFAEVKVFKPTVAHMTRSSFYLIAKNIRKGGPAVDEMVGTWKKEWLDVMFGTDEKRKSVLQGSEAEARVLLEGFGERAIELGRASWRIQADALKKAKWNQ